MRIIRIFKLSVLLLAVSSCATWQSVTAGAQGFPPLESGKGRVLFYRTGIVGYIYASDTSDVLLNGERIGKANRAGVAFKDVTPGSYAVTTTTTAKIVFFHVNAGEQKYVKLNNDFSGSLIFPELVDSAKGEAEASNLSRMGQ